MRKKYRAALVSAGMIANAAHIPAYRNLSEAFELCGICDIRPEAAQDTAGRHGIPGVYTDYEKMLGEIKPDIVSICTPNNLHVAQTITALRHGAHVICEKPLALKYSDARAVFDEAAAAGRYVFPCQTMRYNKEYFPAKEIISAGTLGSIYYGDISYIRRRGVPGWGVFHIKEYNGGGVFCDLGVHMMDYVLWISGNPRLKSISGSKAARIANQPQQLLTSFASGGAPEGVPAPRLYDYREFDTEEFASGSARFEGGMAVNFRIAWALNHPDTMCINLAGDKGGISIPDMKIYGGLGRYQADILPRIIDDPLSSRSFYGHWRLFEQILQTLDGKAPPPVSREEAMNVAAVIDGFYRSAETEREVLMEEIAGS